jgi:hypothetical protein
LRVRPTDALRAFIVVQALLLAWNWATSSHGIKALRHRHMAAFPSRAIAQEVGSRARSVLGGTKRYIAGPAVLASQIALQLDERPRVLLDGRTDISPWVSKARVDRDGVLWIGVQGEAPPAGLQVQALSHGLWWAVQQGKDMPPMPAAFMDH